MLAVETVATAEMMNPGNHTGSHDFSRSTHDNFLAIRNKPIRASSFREEKEFLKPKPVADSFEGFFAASHNFCSSPNLLYPKDDIHLTVSGRGENNKDVPLRRVRSFKTTSKGVIHRGDSFRKRTGSRSASTGVAVDPNSPHIKAQNGHDVSISSLTGAGAVNDPQYAEASASYFKVLVAGAPGTGKTSLTNQFMNSEFADSCDDDGPEERTVTILLDGYEATMEFIDYGDFEDEGNIQDLRYDAYIIIYSVTDHGTFDAAADWIHKLRHGRGTDRPIMLVGNKIDLVRKRKVRGDEARDLAVTYDCKLWETSAALSHHIDDLLIALVKRIRNRLDPEMYPNEMDFELSDKDKKRSFKGPKEVIRGLFRRLTRRGKSKKKKDSD